MSPDRFRFELEDLPLRAAHGRLEVRGWCVELGAGAPPDVRLVIGGLPLAITGRHERADVMASLSAPAACLACGFTLSGAVRPGVHVAHLEAAPDGESWIQLRDFAVIATADRLRFAVEKPPAARPVRQSTRPQGWCVHPDEPLDQLWLHYGNQRIRCQTGLPRTDVPRLVPGSPDAARAGFIAEKNLPVGRGPLRLRAVGRSGRAYFAATRHRIDIATDEDHAEPVDLSGPRPDLGPARRPAEPAPTTTAPRALHILFVLYGDFTANSAIHVGSLANELHALGHSGTVAVARHKETARYFPDRHFAVVDFDEARHLPTPPDVIHAWTTREDVRRLCDELIGTTAARLVVHLEDHEGHILETALGRPLRELLALDDATLDRLVPTALSHPRRAASLLARADGVTAILDKLLDLVPTRKPRHVIWPAADARAFYPRPAPREFRRALGWTDDHTAVFYHGNVHDANRAEVRELYRAVGELNRGGLPCTLLRTGRDFCEFLGAERDSLLANVLDLGRIEHHHHLPPLMALADVFVQPGAPDPFNDYRFPSKLPEFFALGRPVILPRTNLGLVTRHRIDAFVLDRADAPAIAAAVGELRRDPALYERLSRGAAEFAAAHFSWMRSAAALAEFYGSLGAGTTRPLT